MSDPDDQREVGNTFLDSINLKTGQFCFLESHKNTKIDCFRSNCSPPFNVCPPYIKIMNLLLLLSKVEKYKYIYLFVHVPLK